jgi:hypothetical protein
MKRHLDMMILKPGFPYDAETKLINYGNCLNLSNACSRSTKWQGSITST